MFVAVMRTQGSLRLILNTKLWAQMQIDKASEKSIRITAMDTEDQGVKVFLISVSSLGAGWAAWGRATTPSHHRRKAPHHMQSVTTGLAGWVPLCRGALSTALRAWARGAGKSLGGPVPIIREAGILLSQRASRATGSRSPLREWTLGCGSLVCGPQVEESPRGQSPHEAL